MSLVPPNPQKCKIVNSFCWLVLLPCFCCLISGCVRFSPLSGARQVLSAIPILSQNICMFTRIPSSFCVRRFWNGVVLLQFDSHSQFLHAVEEVRHQISRLHINSCEVMAAKMTPVEPPTISLCISSVPS